MVWRIVEFVAVAWDEVASSIDASLRVAEIALRWKRGDVGNSNR